MHTPFFRNGFVESNCLTICFSIPRLGSNNIFLPESFFEMFTSMEPTCSNGSSVGCVEERKCQDGRVAAQT